MNTTKMLTTMKFEQLSKLIFREIKTKLENNQGLFIFAKERAKFEGWLKVELCDSLSKFFNDIAPEKERIDVTFANWAIELKTVNTNIRYRNVENKTRPITKNVQGVIKDIKRLKKSKSYTNKAVLFVVFPITHNNKNWKEHLGKITKELRKVKHESFDFKDKKGNEIPGVIYIGLVNRFTSQTNTSTASNLFRRPILQIKKLKLSGKSRVIGC